MSDEAKLKVETLFGRVCGGAGRAEKAAQAWNTNKDTWGSSGAEVVRCVNHESVVFRGGLTVERTGPDTHPPVTLWDRATVGFKGVVWGSPFGVLARDQEGGQSSQGRLSEFPESSDPSAGLNIFRV